MKLKEKIKKFQLIDYRLQKSKFVTSHKDLMSHFAFFITSSRQRGDNEWGKYRRISRNVCASDLSKIQIFNFAAHTKNVITS